MEESSEEEAFAMEERIDILVKHKLCVFCALSISTGTEGDDGDGGNLGAGSSQLGGRKTPTITQETFLQGITVLCETLDVREDCKRFGDLEEWAPFGGEDFVSFVCCRKCGGALEKIVSLHQLIMKTQASLNENVQKIEDCIFEAEGRIEGGNLEYSVNACVRFRDKLLQYTSRRRRETPEVKKDQPRRTPRPQPKIAVVESTKVTESDSFLISPHSPPSTSVLKLERLNWPLDENMEGLPNYDEEVPLSNELGGYSDDDNYPEDTISSMKVYTDPLLIAEDDDEYRPATKRRRGKGYSKPGRPRIRPVVEKIPGKRGRPRIHPEVERVPGKRGRPRKHPKMEKIPRKRGRPSKIRTSDELEAPEMRTVTAVTDESTMEETLTETHEKCDGTDADQGIKHNQNDDEIYKPSDNDATDNDEEYKPSDNEDDEDFKPTSSRSPIKRSRTATTPSTFKSAKRHLKVKNNSEPPIKKKPGRPLSIGSRRYRLLHEDTPKAHKSIYVVDSTKNIFMFFNVKFQKNVHFLQCLHPDCSHTEPLRGYFTDQESFLNFQYHVRITHRQKQNASQNFYYCHICDSQHDSRDALTEHKRTFHPDLGRSSLLLCEVCGDTLTLNQIIRHTISHKSEEEKEIVTEKRRLTSGKPKDITKPLFFPCDECGKTFKTHAELRLHKPVHLPMEVRLQYICDVCGRAFVSQGSLNKHSRRVHIKDLPTPYVCRICNRKYPTYEKDKYEIHMRTHMGIKPFQCATCGRGFYDKWNLKLHERRHQETRSVACEFCSNVYKEERYLKLHQKKHHPEMVQMPSYERKHDTDNFIGPKQRFPCEPCGHQYIYKSMLITHLKGKHNMKLASRQDYPVMWTVEDQYGFKDHYS